MSQQPTTAIRWCIVAPASAALGWLLHHFGVPASWILGAIIASGAMALSTSEDLIVNKTFYRFNRGIIGIVAAVPLVGVPAKQILESLPAGLFVSFVTVGMGLLVGYLISKNRPEISPESGMLSMLAGGASMMPAIAEEIGDLLFVVTNLARHLKVDPEAALRAANGKFERRFRHIEQALREAGRPIENCSLEELDALWGEAKKLEKLQPGC